MSKFADDPQRFERFEGTSGYIASRSLEDAVNCALALERPLLVKGEPGTGKTLLAHHVAEGLGMPMDSWHIKSTSKAEDGLYVYDTIQRLNDARFGDGDVKDIRSYIRLGPLGRVFSSEERQVLLIDEVDKADLEFPNDILRELDEMQFTVMETGDEVVAKKRPMVIITSNNEKELPDAFLRRCVFHFIDFPDVDQMREIIDVHHPEVEKKLLEQVLVKFYWLRDQKELRKRPSTSELIDWITALIRAGVDPSQLEAEVPFMGALLKNEQDTRTIGGFLERGGTPPKTFDELKAPSRR
jgi:MoxR-like ATPase